MKDSSDGAAMNAQFKKGVLDLCVLTLVAERDYYGYELVEEISRNVDISEGTVYPILNRLRDDGLVTSSWVDSESGHPRKYYSLTRKGYDRATRMAEVWLQFTAGVNALIEPLLPAAQERVRG